MADAKPTFYEFFAGGGMARAGLEAAGFRCLFANDFDAKKVDAYKLNWGDGEVRHADVKSIRASDLPSTADLVWASFPCQDLSLAGGGAGLRGDRSGTFWPFWRVIQGLNEAKRKPKFIILENVCGMLTSHGGGDFAAISDALVSEGYNFGAVVVDAALFLPQSRPRVFFVAVADTVELPETRQSSGPLHPWHTNALVRAVDGLSVETRRRWIWWSVPTPSARNEDLAAVLEDGVPWDAPEDTARLLKLMAPHHKRKVEDAKASGTRVVGTLYRRTRPTSSGDGVQRAEVRFDGVAGCLRTPAGGSSRQTIVVVEDHLVRSRLLSTREAARLMGLPEGYQLPPRYNEAYHLVGDGVAAPVVKYLAENLILPLTGDYPTRLVA